MKLASEIRLLEFTCSEISTNLSCSVVRKVDVINDNERGDRNSTTPESFIAWLWNRIRAKDSKRWESADSKTELVKKTEILRFQPSSGKISGTTKSWFISRFFLGRFGSGETVKQPSSSGQVALMVPHYAGRACTMIRKWKALIFLHIRELASWEAALESVALVCNVVL